MLYVLYKIKDMTNHTAKNTLNAKLATTSSTFFAYACLALGMSLVGIYVALSKPLVAAFPVMLLAWLRFGIAAVYMLPWLKLTAMDQPLDVPTKRLLFVESFLGNFLFSICMLFGVSMAGASSAAIVFAGIPAAVAVLSRLFLHEPLSKRITLAIALVVCGIALLGLNQQGGTQVNAKQDLGYLVGLILLVCAVLCEASYVVIGKRLTETVSPKRISAIVNLWGFALITPFGLWFAFGFDFHAVTAKSWGLLLFYALAASAWSVQLWMTGLKSIPASKAGIFTVMLPVTATLVGVVFLNESFGWVQGLALTFAISGVCLATYSNAKHDIQTTLP